MLKKTTKGMKVDRNYLRIFFKDKTKSNTLLIRKIWKILRSKTLILV